MRAHLTATALALALAAAGCGDNILPEGPPLATADSMTVIAHQDDDLIFMDPDLLDALQSSRGVTNLYITAGNGKKGVDYAEGRDEGLLAAYALATGNTRADWDCGFITIADHPAEHCRLADARVSLVFLGYPDGGELGDYPGSLLQLWEGTIHEATTVSRKPSTYTQLELIATVTAVIAATQPAHLRTLEVASTHGRDHIDHMIAAALAMIGAATAGSEATITSYRGYDTESEPPSTSPGNLARAEAVLLRYYGCANGCAACGESCDTVAADQAVWIARRYAVGFRRPFPAAQLVDTDFGQCMTTNSDGAILLADCATAPTWALTPGGALQSADRCIQVLPTGELIAAHCDPAAIAPAAERFFLDDEGHLWSGVTPAPADAMDYMHLDCLAAGAAGAKVHTDLCGQGHAPTWLALRPAAATGVALPVRGTALRLGDLDGDGRADLARVGSAGLEYFAGRGDGTFAAVATPVGPFAVTPASLALGDVDGDGSGDACGATGSDVRCLIGGAAVVIGPLDAGFGVPDASLAVVDGQVCDDDAGQLACSGTAAPLTSGAAATALWAADLDGDGRPDACALEPGDTGLACVLGSERGGGTAPSPWSFVQGGVVDAAPAGVATTQLADLDGDGLADACDLDADRVACARGQAHAFGPRFTALDAIPPGGDTLLLGDLDGDGHADVCVASATGVSCALSP